MSSTPGVIEIEGLRKQSFFSRSKGLVVRNECKKAKEVGERGTKRGQVAQSFPKKNGV